jgi:hypothetical protein
MMRIPNVLRRVNEAGITLHLSGSEILLGGNVENLEDDLRENIELLRTNGYLWDWCGAKAIDEEAIAFAEALGVESVLVETHDQAILAAKELSRDAADGRVIGSISRPRSSPNLRRPANQSRSTRTAHFRRGKGEAAKGASPNPGAIRTWPRSSCCSSTPGAAGALSSAVTPLPSSCGRG